MLAELEIDERKRYTYGALEHGSHWIKQEFDATADAAAAAATAAAAAAAAASLW